MKHGVFEPALLLLSTLGSVPFVVYWLRLIGAAAFRVRRDERRVPVAVQFDEQWATLLVRFIIASIVAGGAVWAANICLGVQTASELAGAPAPGHTPSAIASSPGPSGHGVFAAVLVGTIWSQTTNLLSRVLLLTYLACIGAALMITQAHSFAALLLASGAGFGAVELARRVLTRVGNGEHLLCDARIPHSDTPCDQGHHGASR